MKIYSYMVVNDIDPGESMAYVLVEGATRDCAVYMRRIPTEALSKVDMNMEVYDVASRGGKVSIRDIDNLPFKIPSHLEYRA